MKLGLFTANANPLTQNSIILLWLTCITFKPLQSVAEVSNKTHRFQHLYEMMHSGVKAHSFSKLSNKIRYILLIHPAEMTSSQSMTQWTSSIMHAKKILKRFFLRQFSACALAGICDMRMAINNWTFPSDYIFLVLYTSRLSKPACLGKTDICHFCPQKCLWDL